MSKVDLSLRELEKLVTFINEHRSAFKSDFVITITEIPTEIASIIEVDLRHWYCEPSIYKVDITDYSNF